jgi:threonyl-tRNA synthetase
MGTLQVDFFMPERLGAYYITETGEKKPPVMLHRAIIGSLERFIGLLLEDTGGDLPLWLAPIQAVVVNITDDQREYAEQVTAELKRLSYRVHCDLRNEKIGFKIREHSMAKVPYIIVVGNKEMLDNTIAVRRGNGEDLGQISVEKLAAEIMISDLVNKI